jgi:preprotein translocase subunit SecA
MELLERIWEIISGIFGGIGRGIERTITSLFGSSNARYVKKLQPRVDAINALESKFQAMSDDQLRGLTAVFRKRLAEGETLDDLLVEAFAAVRESGRRHLGMRHYDVQLMGGMILHGGNIAEMVTGEGKTLVATLPAYLNALVGKGVHVITVNDYLARRDMEWMGPLYMGLGMTVGNIQSGMDSAERQKSYACDITYGTSKEFGFDFLRDRLLLRRMGMAQSNLLNQLTSARMELGGEMPVQREHHFCLVDEADSILIDEARTPLIIGSLGDKAIERIVTLYRWSSEMVPRFVEDEHYEYDHEDKKVELSTEGRQLVRALPKPEILRGVGLIDLYQYIERAIKCDRDYLLDRHYVVKEGEIVIVDENTGRLAEGRKWRDGIHQAIEAKEKIDVSVPTGQAARITVQDLFLRYKHLAGMTGTAASATREFKKVYKMRVIPVPTNRPVQRKRLPDKVYGTSDQKWHAIVDDVREAHLKQRPVLIGTRSIDKSVILSKLLTEAGISHQVLNAHEVATEAEIVARAGEPGKVTVATNMAGRGTDIKLQPHVKDLGGLHVICTELHDSARIDRQLMGRCGRQGDPGTVQQYMSLDDDVLRTGFGPQVAERMAKLGEQANANAQKYLGLIQRAQQKVERRHLRDRFILLFHEKERKKMQQEMGQDPYLDTPD